MIVQDIYNKIVALDLHEKLDFQDLYNKLNVGDILNAQIYGFSLFSPLVLIALLPTTLFSYFLLLVIYRLYFHPLAHIPGPKFPAITYLAEFYYNGIKDGQLTPQLNKWHDKYGPVIRVTPDEVHVRDAELYDKIYYIGSKFSKNYHFYIRLCGGKEGTMFSVMDNEGHKRRRSIVGPLFSRKAVEALEGIIRKRVNNLKRRMHNEMEKPSTPNAIPVPGAFNMRLALRCLTLDVISDYSWGKSFDKLNSDDMGGTLINAFVGMMGSMWMFRQIPQKAVVALCSMAPETVERFDPGAAMFGRMRVEGEKYITKIRDFPDEVPTTHHTLFHEYLKPDSEKIMKKPITMHQMIEEGWGVVFAGTETTGFTMEHCLLGILSRPDIYAKLKSDLHEAFPEGAESMTWRKLEQVPLLMGCIKEGLRMSAGVMSRLPRHVNEDDLYFHGHHMPRGSIVSTASWYMHRDPNIFAEPNEFRPERWLAPNARDLDKYWAPFSRGQRMCVGLQLATCELYHLVGDLIMTENLRLHPAGMQDIKEIQYVDYYLTMPKPGSKRLLVSL